MCSHDLENLEYGRRRPHCKIDGNEFRPVDFRCRVLEFTLNRPHRADDSYQGSKRWEGFVCQYPFTHRSLRTQNSFSR